MEGHRVGGRGRRRKNREPIQVKLEALHPKGAIGTDEQGKTWRVWASPVGATVKAWPSRKHTARRIEITSPSPDAVAPVCEIFGLCGGCQYQEMPINRQRQEKQAMVEGLVGHPSAPIRGTDEAYGYRNKMELSFGVRRYLPEDEKDGQTEGTWLGFHPPGWFSKIVPVPTCPLASGPINTVIAHLAKNTPGPAWNNQDHTGHWRHVVIREGDTVVVNLVTHPSVDEAQVEAVATTLLAEEKVGGVIWTVNDRLADVAQGETRKIWGDPMVRFEMKGLKLQLPHEAFFQVNTAGASVLFDTIGEALGPAENTSLLDLYCGVGAIGLVLGGGYERVVGVELIPEAIAIAKENAAANNIASEWHAGKVETVLKDLNIPGPKHVVVDPPRAGLHPAAASFLAKMDADVLVYVACSPASLARDAEVLKAGGWRLEALWTIDLFPQTPHVEAVARFVRSSHKTAAP
jgi:23S rRNA (uracil-5-)-methyltransferase RumA